MRKFNQVLKEKQIKTEELFEKEVLSQFRSIYSTLLEKYGVAEFAELSEKYQNVFLSELNTYWSEEQGISENGQKFLSSKESILNENSTIDQKVNRLSNKSRVIITETLRTSNIKHKIYNIIDEMYKEIGASEISDVLPTETLFETIKESFVDSLKSVLKEINYELKESAKVDNEEVRLYEREFTEKKRGKLSKTGEALPDGSFPIENLKDLKNAIKAYGRAKNQAAAKRHIIKRARALGASDKLPEKW